MEKYYTPEIEEFHVGFEYEKIIDIPYNKKTKTFGDKVWRKFIVSDSHRLFGALFQATKETRGEDIIRVKHLDQEDIKSLGFKDDVGAGIFFRKRIHTDEEIHLHFGNNIIIERCCVMDEDPIEVVFKGTIKNKSVLKQVLKMLNI